jgi:hypothetical protein
MPARTLSELGLPADRALADFAHSAAFPLYDAGEVARLRGAIARHEHAARGSSVGAAILPDLALRAPEVRELVLAPERLARIAAHVPIPVRIHPMGTNLAHVNLQRPGAEVFDWHVDSSPISVITLLSDAPDDEGATEIRDGAGRTHALTYPGPGHAIVIQGSAIPHRARPTAWPERITLVTSLVAVNPFVRDTKNLDLALHYSDPEVVGADYLGWRLERLLDQARRLHDDPIDLDVLAARLDVVRTEVEDTLRNLEALRARRAP